MRLLFGALSAVFMGMSMISAPIAAAEPCGDVVVVFARGTNEAPGVGATGQSFIDALRTKTGGRSVDVRAVDYPATTDFANSLAAGAGSANAQVQSLAAACPASRIVLGGFSQGASVIDTITGTLPPGVADRVAAVAVFGNPRSAYASSLLGGGPLPAISPAFASRTVDQCLTEDGICGQGWWPFAHDMYPYSEMPGQAADFVVGRL